MKVIVWLLVLVGAGWAAVYFIGGYGSFDPDEQGRKARAAITPGMNLGETIDLMGEPRKYQVLYKRVKRIGGEEFETIEPGPKNNFKRESVEQRIAEGSLGEGFLITMRFSNTTAFTVVYDGEGKVKGVDDAMTMADLLDMRD